MKIGLDIHGVCDNKPEFFRELTKALLAAGWEIHILTGGSVKEGTIMQELEDIGLVYTHLVSLYDYLKEAGAKTNEELGIASRYPFPDETWNTVKARYCEEHKIDMHIDDMPEYLEHFTTPYMSHIDKNRNHRGQYGRHDDKVDRG